MRLEERGGGRLQKHDSESYSETLITKNTTIQENDRESDLLVKVDTSFTSPPVLVRMIEISR